MKFAVKQTFNWFLGWILVVGGIVLVPTPILPGWIFVFIGASLLGWISKKQLERIKEELKKKAEKENKKAKRVVKEVVKELEKDLIVPKL